ncbi:MAG: TonB-dependent receptor, partial [Rhodospirillales bacterium]|nr:TonB-dependent receptor [Rhodospirillales bacterium]
NNYIQRNFAGEVKRSGNQGNIFIKLGLDDSSLGLPGGREVNRPAGIDLVSTDPTGAATQFDIALQNGIDLTIGGTYQLDNNTELILDAGMKRKDQDSTLFDFNRVDTDLTTYSFTPRANTNYSIGPLATTTKFGLDYYYANYNSDRKSGSSAVVPDDRYNAFQQSIAPYAQNKLALTPKTDLNFGIRFQHVNTVAGHTKLPGTSTTQKESLNDQEIQWAANLGLNHKITNFWNVFYRLGRSMRIPTIDERIGSGVEDTNFKLNTQTSNDAEIGFEYTSKNLSLHSSAWSMYIENEIAFNSQAVAFGTNVNYDPTRRYGFENNAVYKVSDKLKINGNLNFIHAEFREGPFEGNDIPLVSPWTASSGLLWNVFGEKLTLSATLNWWDRKYLENDERNIFEKIPSATVADLKVGGQLNSKNYGHAIWSAKVNNVFDESYYNYGVASATAANKFNAFPLPGRTFLLTAGWKY